MTTTMTNIAKTEQRLFIDELCKRWGKNMDQVLDLAIRGELALWIDFAEVYLHPVGTGKRTPGAIPAPGKRQRQTAVRPMPKELEQMQGRNDRMMITLELHCLDAKGREMVLTNPAGEEWGDASMIAIKPANLYTRLEEAIRCEQQQGLAVRTSMAAEAMPGREFAPTVAVNPPDHPCHAGELAIAMTCWQALFAAVKPGEARTDKAGIVRWLGEHAPQLSKTAIERIATVVLPSPPKAKRR